MKSGTYNMLSSDRADAVVVRVLCIVEVSIRDASFLDRLRGPIILNLSFYLRGNSGKQEKLAAWWLEHVATCLPTLDCGCAAHVEMVKLRLW